MAEDYKNLVPHIDLVRSISSVEVAEFNGFGDLKILEFTKDMEYGNDAIEFQLIKNVAYKEMVILELNKIGDTAAWRDFLREEQKTFSGSKIFYINNECSKIIILSLSGEMQNKIMRVINRINKINEKIARINSRIKKENIGTYTYKIKTKATTAPKDEIINMINQNLKV